MPDPQLEFRGLAIDDYAGIRLDISRGFLTPPTVRGEDIVVPARAGRDAGDRIADTLAIMLDGYVGGATSDEWRTNTDALIAALDESGQEPGALIARAPYLGLATGQEATINCRVKNYVEGPIRGDQIQTWSIELESVDPYWQLVTP